MAQRDRVVAGRRLVLRRATTAAGVPILAAAVLAPAACKDEDGATDGSGNASAVGGFGGVGDVPGGFGNTGAVAGRDNDGGFAAVAAWPLRDGTSACPGSNDGRVETMGGAGVTSPTPTPCLDLDVARPDDTVFSTVTGTFSEANTRSTFDLLLREDLAARPWKVTSLLAVSLAGSAPVQVVAYEVTARGLRVTVDTSRVRTPSWDMSPNTSLRLNATLEVSCAEGAADIQVVAGTARLWACGVGADQYWVPDGASCVICEATICEMAPTPVERDVALDALPLAAATEVSLRPLARYARDVVLLAEHGLGSDGVRYHWSVSAGTLEELAPDVALWHLAEHQGVALAQVAVVAEDSRVAAVGALSWGAEA